jgi:hypothetical protein
VQQSGSQQETGSIRRLSERHSWAGIRSQRRVGSYSITSRAEKPFLPLDLKVQKEETEFLDCSEN